VRDAGSQLSKLLDRVDAGEEILLVRAGRPIAGMVPIKAAAQRLPGLLSGGLGDAF
jgi:prevent-host-death family protein